MKKDFTALKATSARPRGGDACFTLPKMVAFVFVLYTVLTGHLLLGEARVPGAPEALGATARPRWVWRKLLTAWSPQQHGSFPMHHVMAKGSQDSQDEVSSLSRWRQWCRRRGGGSDDVEKGGGSAADKVTANAAAKRSWQAGNTAIKGTRRVLPGAPGGLGARRDASEGKRASKYQTSGYHPSHLLLSARIPVFRRGGGRESGGRGAGRGGAGGAPREVESENEGELAEEVEEGLMGEEGEMGLEEVETEEALVGFASGGGDDDDDGSEEGRGAGGG